MNKQAVAKELVSLAKSLVADNPKEYNIQYNIGKAKYVVNYSDGSKTHRDGSRFFDIAIFSNKKSFERFVKQLKQEGYVEGW